MLRPDRHLLVERGHMHLSLGPRENRFRPAIDPLFRSAALHYGPRVAGVILSGELYDGSAGLYDVKRRGGVAIVQDPRTATFPSMPLSALTTVVIDHCLKVEEVAPVLVRLARERTAAALIGPVPQSMQLESRIVAMEPISVEDMNAAGTPTNFVCPECHGALWKLNGEGPLRLRCHVGHGYTAENFSIAQKEEGEDNLWRALQSMDERTAFMRQMAAAARKDDRPDIAETWGGNLPPSRSAPGRSA